MAPFLKNLDSFTLGSSSLQLVSQYFWIFDHFQLPTSFMASDGKDFKIFLFYKKNSGEKMANGTS